jgi:hypothetical protein
MVRMGAVDTRRMVLHTPDSIEKALVMRWGSGRCRLMGVGNGGCCCHGNSWGRNWWRIWHLVVCQCSIMVVLAVANSSPTLVNAAVCVGTAVGSVTQAGSSA